MTCIYNKPLAEPMTTQLTHWGRATHICVGKLTIIGSDNGLSPGRRQAIIWTNARILLIGPLGTNFNEIFIEICTFSCKKIHLKMSYGKWRPFCLGLNVLTMYTCVCFITSMSYYIDSLVQDCSNSSALALELLTSCTKPSIYPAANVSITILYWSSESWM